MNIEEIFPDGRWVSEEEFLIQCPICGDGDHNHCYINTDKKVFFCHRNGCRGPLSKILKHGDIELEPKQKVVQDNID